MRRSTTACNFIAKVIGVLLLAATPAFAANISASFSMYYSDIFTTPETCSLSESFTGDPVVFSVSTSFCPAWSPPPGSVVAIGHFTAMSGGFSAGPDCDRRGCNGSFSVDGDYYFAGSGIQTFNFGMFSNTGPAWLIVNSVLWIDGQVFPILQRAAFSPLVTLQLGEVHHLTYAGNFSETESGAFSYNFHTPGIDVSEVPEPERGWAVLIMGMASLLFRSRRNSHNRLIRRARTR